MTFKDYIKEYFIPEITDGLLYVDFPYFDNLTNFLKTKEFKSTAHFRTREGKTPYNASGIAFKSEPLIKKGVKPIWYLKPNENFNTELQKLIDKKIYDDDIDAHKHNGASMYSKECEWEGPVHMEINLNMIDHIWIHPNHGSKENIKIVENIAPDVKILIKTKKD